MIEQCLCSAVAVLDDFECTRTHRNDTLVCLQCKMHINARERVVRRERERAGSESENSSKVVNRIDLHQQLPCVLFVSSLPYDTNTLKGARGEEKREPYGKNINTKSNQPSEKRLFVRHREAGEREKRTKEKNRRIKIISFKHYRSRLNIFSFHNLVT
jgi:hypothetical protein